MKNGKVIIFSAPSGSGKSTVVNHLLKTFDNFELSISATSRKPRGLEQHGREYYFISASEFRRRIKAGRFVEYEEVYAGTYYGTLKSELRRIWRKGHIILFDVDVVGGVNLKRYFGPDALSVFIQAPSPEVLRERLVKRATDSPEAIEERVAKAAHEMTFAPLFDRILINDDLALCLSEAEAMVKEFAAAPAPPPKKRAALYFGSFNPLHKGHLQVMRHIVDNGLADSLRLVVTPETPFGKSDLAAPSARLAEARRAVAENSLPVEVSDMEFTMPKPNYTINTLERFSLMEPDAEHILVIGADCLEGLCKWHRAADIINRYPILVYPREGSDMEGLCAKISAEYRLARITPLDAPLCNISSTRIREGEKAGEDMGAWRV